MRQIKVDSPDVRELGDDHAEAGSGASTDIDELLETSEAGVGVQHLLQEKGA